MDLSLLCLILLRFLDPFIDFFLVLCKLKLFYSLESLIFFLHSYAMPLHSSLIMLHYFCLDNSFDFQATDEFPIYKVSLTFIIIDLVYYYKLSQHKETTGYTLKITDFNLFNRLDCAKSQHSDLWPRQGKVVCGGHARNHTLSGENITNTHFLFSSGPAMLSVLCIQCCHTGCV